MKKLRLNLLFVFLFTVLVEFESNAQCSLCTKTASQMGEKPAKALNGGIVYLMFTPLIIATYIGIKWWKREKEILQNEG